MITLLPDQSYEKARKLGITSPSSAELLSDTSLKPSLEKYLLLTDHPETFETDETEIFYNRYFWFLSFIKAYTAIHGFDAGLEQQASQLLEGSQSYDSINWETVEEIANSINK